MSSGSTIDPGALVHQRPLLIQPNGPLVFPDPSRADDEGLVAIGGDLSPERLALAYGQGIFPWFNEGFPILWWSPNPRAIIEPGGLHVSRSMRRLLRRGQFSVTLNHSFVEVMQACGQRREGGTWILPEMREAYRILHQRGHAHSFEVWSGSELVGGLYGVHYGGLFAAESMFHTVSNTSKLALVAATMSLFRAGIELFDVQFLTPHLRSLGAREIPRREYLGRVAQAVRVPVGVGSIDVTGGLGIYQVQ